MITLIIAGILIVVVVPAVVAWYSAELYVKYFINHKDKKL
jgi:hypothetical protein